MNVRRAAEVSKPEAGLGSTLPAESIDRTSKVWLPELSAETVKGELQDSNGPSSTRHSNRAASLAENSKVGVESSVEPLGPEVMEVSGGAESST